MVLFSSKESNARSFEACEFYFRHSMPPTLLWLHSSCKTLWPSFLSRRLRRMSGSKFPNGHSNAIRPLISYKLYSFQIFYPHTNNVLSYFPIQKQLNKKRVNDTLNVHCQWKYYLFGLQFFFFWLNVFIILYLVFHCYCFY